MNVLYTCDNNYVWLMGISAISLFENNKAEPDLSVFLLGENISDVNKELLKNISDSYDRKITVIDVPQFDIPPSLISARWPLSAFTRLFSGLMLPKEIDKVLYLDCDTIITGDISPLDKIEFGGNIALGVKDCISGTYKKNIGLDSESPYINAGVILFDMNALRGVDIQVEIEAYMRKYEQLINYADQDILNGLFKGRIGSLDPKYDVMTIYALYTYEELQLLRKPTSFYPVETLINATKHPVIIHYTTNMLAIRPWFSDTDHPYADEFRTYLNKSPWKNRELSPAVFNSKEAKIIRTIMLFPKSIAFRALGLIHAELKPRYIKLRSK